MSNGRDTVSSTDDNAFKSSDRENQSAIANLLSLNVHCAKLYTEIGDCFSGLSRVQRLVWCV